MKQSYNGWSYPKMLPEVIEAVETHFCDEKDVMIDCMLYLLNASARVEDVHMIENWFEEHHICRQCGEPHHIYEYFEPHSEIGPNVYETMREYYCPNCDTSMED